MYCSFLIKGWIQPELWNETVNSIFKKAVSKKTYCSQYCTVHEDEDILIDYIKTVHVRV